jgi:hypothetical protein
MDKEKDFLIQIANEGCEKTKTCSNLLRKLGEDIVKYLKTTPDSDNAFEQTFLTMTGNSSVIIQTELKKQYHLYMVMEEELLKNPEILTWSSEKLAPYFLGKGYFT